MDHIVEHKRVEEDQVQGKWMAKVFISERRDPWPNRYGPNWWRRDFVSQPPQANAQVVSSVFKEPVYRILEKKWALFQVAKKRGRDPTKHNQSLYCQYHQDRGYTTKDYRTLRDHLEQLVKVGKLKQFMHQSPGQGS